MVKIKTPKHGTLVVRESIPSGSETEAQERRAKIKQFRRGAFAQFDELRQNLRAVLAITLDVLDDRSASGRDLIAAGDELIAELAYATRSALNAKLAAEVVSAAEASSPGVAG